MGFSKKEEEYKVLIEQRMQLVVHIREAEKSFHQLFTVIVTFFSTAIALLVNTDFIPFDGVIIFILIQALFLFLLFLLGLLSQMNNHRDYIRAIDQYLRDNYNITTLFYQGELGYKHVSGIKSSFSLITMVGGSIAIILVGVIFISKVDLLAIFSSEPFLFLIICFEALVIIAIVYNNFAIYKLTGRSKFYNDCLVYLNKNKSQKNN